MQDSIVQAKIRALNQVGWGPFSQANKAGLRVFVEPVKMQKVTRGTSTTESQIEILLTPITDLLLAGGSAITSYNLQWKVANSSEASF